MNTAPQDYNLQIKVRNGRLLKKMRENGYETVRELQEVLFTVNYNTIRMCMSLEMTLYDRNGYIRPCWQDLGNFFNCDPVDLVPPAVHKNAISRRVVERDISEEQILSIASDSSTDMLLIERERKEVIDEALSSLTKREDRILRMYYGLGCGESNLAVIGEREGITRSRVAQIVNRAERKLKHPSRAYKMRDFVNA